jgi:lipopolysaccharide export LptBFGC system permease protein LptF
MRIPAESTSPYAFAREALSQSNWRSGQPGNLRLPDQAPATTAFSLRHAQRQVAQNIEGHISSIRSYRHSMNSLLVEIHKKYSIPVACIVFVLIGVPLGVMNRRGGMAVSGGMSLGFFLLYWGFLIAGEDLADRQMLSPFLAMWLANIIVGGFGLYLLIAVAKERATIDFRDTSLRIRNWVAPRRKAVDGNRNNQ